MRDSRVSKTVTFAQHAAFHLWGPRSQSQVPSEPAYDEASDFDWVGEVGAYYFAREADWIRRHVESIEIVDERLLRRKLTVDLDLPTDPNAAVQRMGKEAVFYLPVALLAKTPPTSNINLLDETGLTVPLLTRNENALLSAIAFEAALEATLDPIPTALSEQVPDIVFSEVEEANFAYGVFVVAAKAEQPRLADHPQGDRLLRVARELAQNSMLWMRLQGPLGQRRVIQFAYDVSIFPPRILPTRRPKKQVYELPDGNKRTYPSPVSQPGRGARTIAGRLARRFATNFGFSTVDLYVEQPHIREADSYHLQVKTPPGLELRAIELQADLRERDTDEELEPVTQISASQGHLYFADADVKRGGPALVSVRAGRRGFLTLSAMTAGVITALLTAFYLAAEAIAEDTERQVAAGVALVVPALLAAFAVRPGEHLLTTRLLSGVRFLVLLAALASVAAAASLADVQLSLLGDDHKVSFGICAGIAAASTTLLAVAVLTSLTFYFKLTRRFRTWRLSLLIPTTVYRALCVGSVGAIFVGLLLLHQPGSNELQDCAVQAGLLLLAAAVMAVLSALRFSVSEKASKLWEVTAISTWVIYLACGAGTLAAFIGWHDVQIIALAPPLLLFIAGTREFAAWDEEPTDDD